MTIPAEDSLPGQLFARTLSRILERYRLTEQSGEGGGPCLTLESQLPMVQGEVGNVRLFTGAPLFRLVTCSMVAEPMQLDSHMMFAFTPGDSPVPHFTLDSVKAGEHFAFHLDLIPRVDLGANKAYMDEVFLPLTELYETGNAIEGLTRAHLSPRQYAIMSPWMFVSRADEAAFSAISETVAGYTDHWCSVLDGGVSREALGDVSADELRERNLRNKRIIFDPEVDPVWHRITGLIGQEAVDMTRRLLIGEDE